MASSCPEAVRNRPLGVKAPTGWGYDEEMGLYWVDGKPVGARKLQFMEWEAVKERYPGLIVVWYQLQGADPQGNARNEQVRTLWGDLRREL